MRTHRSRCVGARRATTAPSTLEALESRIVLAVDAVGVGFVLSGGVPTPVVIEYGLDDDLNFTSSLTQRPGAGGPAAATLDDPVAFELFSNGRLGVVWPGQVDGAAPDAFPGFDAEASSQFFAQQDYGAGFFLGAQDGQADASVFPFIERHAGANIVDLAGNWRFHMLRFVTGQTDPTALTGNASFGGNFMLLGPLTGDPGAGIVARSIEFDPNDVRGRFDGSGSTRLYLNHDASVFLAMDLDTGGGDTWIAIGSRAVVDAEDQPDIVAGRYRTLLHAPNAAAEALMGSALAGRWIDIRDNGSYTVRDLLEDDRGEGDVIASGSWSIVGSTLELTDADTGDILRFTVADGGRTLLAIQQSSGSATNMLFGMGQQVSSALIDTPDVEPTPPGGPLELPHARVNEQGRPEVFELDESGLWRRVDLIDRATGPVTQDQTAQDIILWTDPINSLTYAAVTTADRLFLYTRDDDGAWTVRDLTAELPAGDPVASNLVQFISRDLVVYLGGLNADGEVIFYTVEPVRTIGAPIEFAFRNVSQLDLPTSGSSTPAFAGDLTSFVTSWNALNLAGLDAAGDVWAVWRSPQGVWRSVNLSEQTGADPLQGSLTVFLTSWGGINIAGVSGAGEVLAAWWVPGFSTWRNANLSQDAGAPALQTDSVTSWVTPWGALNVGGLDADNDVVALWWVPGFQRWQVANLTESLAPSEPRPQGALEATVIDSGVMSVFGTRDDDDLVRVYWTPGVMGWRIQNLSDLSVVG